MKNLIYLCVFYNKKYMRLIELFLSSYALFCQDCHETTDICVITDETFVDDLNQLSANLGLQIKLWVYPPTFIHDFRHKIFISTVMRYYIFDWSEINNYDTILYCDTDILFHTPLKNTFSCIQDPTKIYTLREGNLDNDFWGGPIFDFTGADAEINPRASGICSGVFLFKNNLIIRRYFADFTQFIFQKMNMPDCKIPICYDQPYFNYFCFKNNIHDNEILSDYAINRQKILDGHGIYHYPEVHLTLKYKDMILMLTTMINSTPCNPELTVKVHTYLISGTEFINGYNEDADPLAKYSSYDIL